MNRIRQLLASFSADEKRRKLLSAYIMPGFPKAESTLAILDSVEKAGADFVELGVPFSDPLADGPVIQAASQAAILNGMSPTRILELVRAFRRKSELPIILMGYMNSFLNGFGNEFATRLKSSGVDGLIIPDLSLEESAPVRKIAEESGLSLVLLVAPTSTDERIRLISKAASDFVYCVSVTGVTGARKNLASDSVISFLKRVNRISEKPYVVGFGISTPEVAKEVSRYSNGVVVGSALLEEISASPESAQAAYKFLKGLRDAVNKSGKNG